jgi:hypothetical protein
MSRTADARPVILVRRIMKRQRPLREAALTSTLSEDIDVQRAAVGIVP